MTRTHVFLPFAEFWATVRMLGDTVLGQQGTRVTRESGDENGTGMGDLV